MSFAEWRRRARLLRALGWIAEGRPILAVALDLGYDSPSAFSAMFRRELGAAALALPRAGSESHAASCSPAAEAAAWAASTRGCSRCAASRWSNGCSRASRRR